MIFAAACGNDDTADSRRENVFTEPYLKWGALQSDVKQRMQGFTPLFEDESMLVYVDGDDGEMISYGFVAGKLCTSIVLVRYDAVASSDLERFFDGYSQVSGYDETTFVDTSVDTVGEISVVEYSGNDYTCIGWSRLNM